MTAISSALYFVQHFSEAPPRPTGIHRFSLKLCRQHLQRLQCMSQHTQCLLAQASLCSNVVTLAHDLSKQLLPVQSMYQMLLQSTAHVIDEEMHQGFGHRVLEISAHNIKVRVYENTSNLDLDLLLVADRFGYSQRL